MTNELIQEKPLKVHLIGIGGIGMSAVAELCFSRAYRITGSDQVESRNVMRLKQMGIAVQIGHASGNISDDLDMVIYSSAIQPTNPEFQAAKQKSLAMMTRGEALALLMQGYDNIVVSGTHGKTTTTSLISHVLTEAGVDPTYSIGGVLQNTESPVRVGQSNYFVAEADESDASFLHLSPHYIVITNIDSDHLETYAGDFAELKKSFLGFVNKAPDDAIIILCIDDPVCREMMPKFKRAVITYGFDLAADYALSDFVQNGLQANYQINRRNKETQTISLNLPGQHNALNATAAIVVSDLLNVNIEKVKRALKQFPGVGRRFQSHGVYKVADGEALLFEDYGHHPNEIKATLNAARQAWPERRIAMVFQPHRYSRTRDLLNDFVDVLSKADLVILLDIYAAGELPIMGVSADTLLAPLKQLLPESNLFFVPNLEDVPSCLAKQCRPDDVILLQGAGSIGSMAAKLTQ